MKRDDSVNIMMCGQGMGTPLCLSEAKKVGYLGYYQISRQSVCRAKDFGLSPFVSGKPLSVLCQKVTCQMAFWQLMEDPPSRSPDLQCCACLIGLEQCPSDWIHELSEGVH